MWAPSIASHHALKGSAPHYLTSAALMRGLAGGLKMTKILAEMLGNVCESSTEEFEDIYKPCDWMHYNSAWPSKILSEENF